VTLLFGVPLSLGDFVARFEVDSTCRSDFLSKYDNLDLSPESRDADRLKWWGSRYENNVARPLVKLAGEALALGCAVRERATLGDLSAAARADGIVIVFSHWKGPEFSNDDFLAGFEENVTARLERIVHPLATAILQSMRLPRRWLPFAARNPLDAREALRQSLDAPVQDQQTAGDMYYELDATRQARRRDELDDWLNGLIQPGNRLELFDGLHSAHEISRAISPDFRGVLDLTVCTSTYLGDYLGRTAAQRFRTVQFLEPQDFLEASIRMSLVLTLFAQSKLTYVAARSAVYEAYMRVIGDMARHRGRGGPSNE
jgi:hypothetical protein